MEFPTRISGPAVAIGDIHGQTEQLAVLLNRLERDETIADRWVVFLGDFVDRGPDPAGAIDLILQFLIRHPKTTAVCGNHDLALLGALGWIPAPEFCEWKSRWLGQYDSQSTFASYGVPFGEVEQLAEKIPTRHREFLAALPWLVEHPDYVFVHAGLDSKLPADVQLEILRRRDFTLNRPPWLCSRTVALGGAPKGWKKTIVSGHVRVPQVQFEKRRILVDTAGGLGGDLSAVLLPDEFVITSAEDTPAERNALRGRALTPTERS